MPLSPDFCRCKHTTRTAHVTESSLTSTVSTTARDTRNTCNSTTYISISAIYKANQTPVSFIISVSYLQSNSSTPVVLKRICTNRYPKTQQKSDDQLFRSPHMAASCSSPCQYEQSYMPLAIALHYHSQRSYWIISGRIGDWKTLGSGCVEPLALPSADRIVTVGREAILMS